MVSQDLRRFVEEGVLSKGLAIEYLNTYIGDLDWEPHINRLYSRLQRDYANDIDGLRIEIREIIACAILLPLVDGKHHISSEDKARLLYTCRRYRQFTERDWSSLLRKVATRDLEIESWRKMALQLGIVERIQYQPLCREAYNRLYNAAEESGCVTDKNKDTVIKHLKRLVWSYGGNVITKVFTTNEKVLNKVLDWRTGYFFERAIFETYTLEQVLKIKKHELSKTNQDLVRRFNFDAA